MPIPNQAAILGALARVATIAQDAQTKVMQVSGSGDANAIRMTEITALLATVRNADILIAEAKDKLDAD